VELCFVCGVSIYSFLELKFWQSIFFETAKNTFQAVPKIWGESLWNPSQITLMPQKPPEGNYSQTNVFAIHEFAHLYLCRCRWLCERTKVCFWINTFASEFNTFLSRIKLFLLNFLLKEYWKNAPLAGFVCVFLQSCNTIIFTFTGKCLIILMFYASIFDWNICY